MPAVVTPIKTQFKVNLDNGSDGDGNIKTVNAGFPAISQSSYDPDKALAIVTALEPCLTKTVYSCSQIVTSTVAE